MDHQPILSSSDARLSGEREALGRREGESLYEDDDLDALGLLCNYVALSVQNHMLTQTLAQRVAENLRLLASLHGFYDNALAAFASAIDVRPNASNEVASASRRKLMSPKRGDMRKSRTGSSRSIFFCATSQATAAFSSPS